MKSMKAIFLLQLAAAAAVANIVDVAGFVCWCGNAGGMLWCWHVESSNMAGCGPHKLRVCVVCVRSLTRCDPVLSERPHSFPFVHTDLTLE